MSSAVLFFSTRCEHCKNLISLIQANELMHRVRPYCVDNQPVPREVESVPTIIGPDMKVYRGMLAFDYIKHLCEDDVQCYELGSSGDTIYSFVNSSGEMERSLKYMYTEEEPPFMNVDTDEKGNMTKGNSGGSQAGVDPRLAKLIEARKTDSSIPTPIMRT